MKKVILVVAGVVIGLLVVLFGALIIQGSYNKSHVILDGTSMEPTLRDGQNLSLVKYSEGNSPKRGDIVEYSISKPRPQYAKYKDHKLVHRIIGLPGERITVSNGQVLVFNKEHPEGFNPDASFGLNVKTGGDIDITLEPKTYFTLGDNRPNALDSRTLGPIPIEDVIAKVK